MVNISHKQLVFIRGFALSLPLFFLMSCGSTRYPGGRIGGVYYKGGKAYEDGCGNRIEVPMRKRKSLFK